ncbi:MAG: histidine kinase [Bacteroidetes bacterium]|nr:histidine kinase [Bacteroidota bacterium]
MDNRYKTLRYSEIGLLVFVWLVLMMTPVLFREDNNRPLMRSMLNQLEILVPLTILFLANRFVLVPRFLFRGKVISFFTSVLGVILLLAVASYVYDEKIKQYPSERVERADRPPRRGENPPPSTDSRPERPEQTDQARGRQPRPVPPFANFLILGVLVVGFDTGLRSGLRWIMAEDERIRLEKENVTAQLTLLRNQVSPHFFMNTLNNIHALVDTNTAEAKEAIIKLSKMMRYLLYETETEKTTLKKEVEFLESYINLMRLRFSEKVRITLNLPAIVPDAFIPPFLFTAFIENAFKHGISYRNESFITIDLIPGKERLLFVVKNSRSNHNGGGEFSGIGIENTRKRLDLLFGDAYHLDIIDTEELFTVNLSIPI